LAFSLVCNLSLYWPFSMLFVNFNRESINDIHVLPHECENQCTCTVEMKGELPAHVT
jgi:hypothetical protein